jgi:hypothetical protein
MKEKYIHDIAESFAKRTASDGRATPNWACQSGARLSTRWGEPSHRLAVTVNGVGVEVTT